ncbi:WXG100 family type VII secretion target [Amycolatopsis sp. Hca4]|uniref:WXG100 family type VII secretion target n=1 Tax=Amycolatopsis sp. Hca4 TaxID=2742131 RepID=UPI00158FA0FD|nr:WXG100 family type VII secretion target [Amycolatopsis sp. Hca4]QKV77221.1 WXG100 family type VII secretion target [Amycolatopsis sp. Hca4]
MVQLTVDFSVLRTLVDDLGSHIDDTDRCLDELGEIVADLATCWTGAGHDAFHEAITEWFVSARDLRDQLRWIRTVVVNAHDNHAAAVDANVRIWRV